MRNKGEEKLTYASSLWNCFETTYNQFKNKRKVMKDYIFVLNEKANLDLDYSKKVKKLYDYNYLLNSDTSLGICALDMREYYNNLSSYCNDYAESLKKEVVYPIDQLIMSQLEFGSRIEKENKRIDREYIESVSTLERTKQKYLNLSQIAESATKDYETSKICQIQTSIDKFQNKSIASLKEAKDAESVYIHQLKITNKVRENYINECTKILNTLEDMDYKLSLLSKESFQKYSIFSNAFVTNQNYDMDKLKNSLTQINIEQDNQRYIEKNKKNYIHPPEFVFNHYKFQLKIKPVYEHNIPVEVVLNTIRTLQNTFELKYDDWSYEDELNKVKVYEISNIAIRGAEIDDNLKSDLVKLLDIKKYRLLFLSLLNNHRVKGQFNINQASYELIGQIFKKILISIEENQDYESAKFVIILSQTFKYDNKSLQYSIIETDILKGKEFWESMIACKSTIIIIFYRSYF